MQIRYEVEEDLPPIKGDADRLHQALLNIVINALQAMPEGGLLTTRARYMPEENQIQVQIEDTGCGIPEGEMERLFEFFYSTKPEGTGIGLSISYQVISDHGGEIDVISRPGEGTVFTISLPTDPAITAPQQQVSR